MIAWLFDSPARLACVLAGLLASTVVVVAIVWPAAPAPTGRPPAAVQRPLDLQEAKMVAESFIGVWCELGIRTPDQWVAEMRSRSTGELAEAWTVNVAENLTGDCPWGQEDPRWVRESAALIAVDTKRGRPVLVTVEQVGGRVLVAAVGNDEGGD